MKASFVKNAILVFLFFILSTVSVSAQCAMCRAALETEETGVQAAAVNDGIVYLMIFPYLLVGVVGYFVYKVVKKKKQKKTI
ncbi:hypothetical protein [Flavobacterium sp. NKUCC04_CG]|uniref:hypothetical protein n=1 Tax=Flavobacterium sp. NKUCC04_CG TaxID=2842121 RepID=UPI001C5B4406|nr:hypothetical protein [Flavobacterium sp. NKUCC04_CG]MBW3518220.1 hypothetical protein [Flavobacterium sp. NKUCC04_CG]